MRLAAAPMADLMLPLMQLGVVKLSGRGIVRLLEFFGTDLGNDADDFVRTFDALPDRRSRRAFVRTLRAVVDVRGQSITMLDRCYLTQHIPTLLMWGTRDAIIPFAHAQIAHAAMPQSRLEVFPGAGHFPHHKAPDRFLAVLRRFLRETDPGHYSAEAWRELLKQGRPAALPVAGAVLNEQRPVASAT